MANGIASAELVIALGQAQLLGSFGAAGLTPKYIETAIQRIQSSLPNGPYMFNLIHSPSEEALERNAVELYLKHGDYNSRSLRLFGADAAHRPLPRRRIASQCQRRH